LRSVRRPGCLVAKGSSLGEESRVLLVGSPMAGLDGDRRAVLFQRGKHPKGLWAQPAMLSVLRNNPG